MPPDADNPGYRVSLLPLYWIETRTRIRLHIGRLTLTIGKSINKMHLLHVCYLDYIDTHVTRNRIIVLLL